MNLELGVIGNCEIAALIDESARIVWSCLPRLDGDPVFCSLLSREGGDAANGVFAVEMPHGSSSEQRYLRNTAILETLLDDGARVLERAELERDGRADHCVLPLERNGQTAGP